MKGGGGGGDQGQDNNSYALLWIIAGVFVIGVVAWHFFGDKLKAAFIQVKLWETVAISFFVDNENVQRALQGLNMVTPSTLNMNYAAVISTFIGQYLIYPVGFMLVVMAIVMLRGHATMRFTKTYSMDSLAKQEKDNWPQISPVVDLNLIDQDITEGGWAMSMNPMHFARHYKLLKVEMVADRKAAWRSAGIPKATLIREKAAQMFSTQLGPLWSGVDNLPPHTKALYACFLARIEHDTDACRGYLGKLARSAAKGEIDYSGTDELFNKYGNCKAAKLCQTKHAYVLTVMATMLELARSDGVLASADFLWVKPLDRRLWYTLNCVGRQVAVPEVGGVFAHWLAEKEMGRALTVPMIDEAINALDIALANIVYVLDESEEVAPSAESGGG